MMSILHRIYRQERSRPVWAIDKKIKRTMFFLAFKIWINILIFKFKNDYEI